MPLPRDDASAPARRDRWPRFVAAGVVAGAIGVAVVRAIPGEPDSALAAAVADARAFADSLDRTPDDGSSRSAVVRGYLIRQRDGLGSPFRLIDLARLDPRLAPPERARLALALLARTAALAPLPPAAPGALALAAAPATPPGGAALAATIERLVLDDPSPETLEAVRIAALVAGADGSLQPRAVPLVGATAVLVRDRLRARADAAAILAEAARRTGDALMLVTEQRVARRLASERPSLAEAAPDPRRVATRIAPIAREFAAVVTAARDTVPVPSLAVTWLSTVAERPRARAAPDRPPQPPVRLALQDAAALVGAVGDDDGAGRALRPLLAARHEESVAASLPAARADARGAATADVAALLVAQGMRTLAQESPWHPGLPLPAPDAVAAQLGLGSLRFGADVPRAWRAWYARELAHAISSLRIVFPFATVAGLHVRIG
nr:hypothetical protein [Gemmatimonadaceae bacterium]